MQTSDYHAVMGGPIFTGRCVLDNHAIVVKGDTIEALVPVGSVPARAKRVPVDGRLIAPGFVNAHHHAYSALATGLPKPPAHAFREVLEQLWWRLDQRLDAAALRLSARWTALQCLQHGVTTVLDHHASYGVIGGALEIMREEFEGCGLSSAVCFEVSGRHGAAAAHAAIQENLAFIPGARTARLFGLHAAFTLDDHTLAQVRDHAPPDCGFHVHCAEDAIDGGGVIERLAAFGILRPSSLLVHGVHLTDDELRRVAAAGAAIIHCPESNMHNGVGAFDLVRAAGVGVRVAAGTDGLHSSMLRSYAAAYLLSRHVQRSPCVGYEETRAMYTATQALAARLFPDIGAELQAGRRADIAVLAYRPHTPLHDGNVWAHLLYGAAPAPVHATISGGRVRYCDGAWPGVDVQALSAQCAEAAQRLWKDL